MKLNIGRKRRGRGVVFWLAAAFFVCEATGLSFGNDTGSSQTASAGKAVVYVYRNAGIFGAGNALDLFANGQPITRITNGGYYDFAVAPGKVELGVLTALRPIAILTALVDNAGGVRHLYTLHAEAGHTYYLRYEPGFGSEKLIPVAKEEAVKAMAGMSRFQPAQK